MKGAYLLDTNHLGAAINPASSLRERLHQAHRRGARLGTCVVDIMIAALAQEMGLTILTSDQDFAALPGISVENWLI
jgi:predicted nucleic acid-binding protein